METLPFRLLALEDGQIALADKDDDVRGLVVIDSNGHRVGEVDDIMVDDQVGRARLLVVSAGGVLGLAAHRHLVPVEAVARVTDHVHLHHSDDAVLAAEDHDPALVDARDYEGSYRHFGHTPFWEPTPTTPYFHDRRW